MCVCMHVCLFNIKRSISRHRLSFPKDTFPPASRREEIFYIPAREEKQVMNRYNIPGMAFLKFVTPCKILLCVGTVYFVPPSAVVKLFLSSRCDLFFPRKKSCSGPLISMPCAKFKLLKPLLSEPFFTFY